jgi:hypothetical protein
MTTYGYRFRYAFNTTLLIGGAFGIAAGGANSFAVLAVLVAFMGLGIGGSLVSLPEENVNLLNIYYCAGNIPVDTVLLLG